MRFRVPSIVLAALALTACVYRIDIQQGNLLDDEDIVQIEVGMTRSQVQFLLGTPMVADSFHRDRWDYAYYFRRGRSPDLDPALGRRPFRERPSHAHRSRSSAATSGLNERHPLLGRAPSQVPPP